MKATAPIRLLWSLIARTGVPGPWLEEEMRALKLMDLRDATVIDVGANVGKFSLFLSRYVHPNGIVIAYEPYSKSANLLRIACRIAHAKNVTLRQVALADRKCQDLLAMPVTRHGSVDDPLISLNYPGSHNTVRTDVTTLDEDLRALGVGNVQFIKCDVEGAEFGVFSGAKLTIKASLPIILCELDYRWSSRFGTSPKDTINLLSGLGGYVAFRVKGSHLERVVISDSTIGNYFIIPETSIHNMGALIG